MALIITNTPPVSAATIWSLAQLPLGALSCYTNADAIAKIDREILPSVSNYVMGKVQEVTIPYGYPFDELVLQSGFTQLSLEAVYQIVGGWDTTIQGCIQYFALADLFLAADTTDKDVLKESQEYRAIGYKMLDNLLIGIRGVMTNLPDNQANKGLGVIIIKNRKNKGPRGTGDRLW